MSFSHFASVDFCQEKISATNKSQLDFDNIYDLLNQGLINFIACFADNKDKTDKFREMFATHLLNPMDKNNYNQFGIVLIKAAYPGILKLTSFDADILNRMGILYRQQSAEESISQFFKKEEIYKFVDLNVGDKYKNDIYNMIDAVYKFIVTATCSLEYEQLLVSYDKNNQPIVDKNSQDAIFSSIDLQFGTATNNLKLASDKLVKAKGRTTKVNEITKSLEKIRSLFAKAAAEYAKNLSEQRAENLKKHSQKMAADVDQAKFELYEVKEALQSVQAQLEEEKRRAQELAELAEERQKALAALAEKSQSSSSSSSEVDDLRKQNNLLREQQRMKESAHAMTQDAKDSGVNRHTLIHIFQELMSQLNSSSHNARAILTSLIGWEKAAFSYLMNKKSSVSSAVVRKLPTMMVSTLSFIGRKTGMGQMKTTDPEQALALETGLIAVIQQCLWVNEIDKDFISNVKMLDQHLKNLTSTHNHDVLSQSTVFNQFAEITNAMIVVAEEFFAYKNVGVTLGS